MSRRLGVLLGLVLALSGARVAISLTRSGGPEGIGERVLAGLDRAKVFRISLRRGEQRVTLERDAKSPTGWVVASHGRIPARKNACEALLERLAGWRRERVAGSDPAQHAAWAVDEAQARRVRLEDSSGKPLAAVMVGKITGLDRDRAKEGGHSVEVETLGLFVREATIREGKATFGPRVIVVNEFVVRELEPVARSWFLRPLVSGERKEVSRVTVTQGGESLTVTLRPPPTQLVGDPRPADPAKAFGLLTYLWLLEPIGPAPPGVALGRDAVSVQIERGDASETISIGSVGARRFVRVGDVTVEVNPHEADRVVALATVDGLIRRRITNLTADQLGRFHWEGAAGEVAVVRGPRGQYAASVTGPGVPLRHATPSRGQVDAVAQALTKLQVTRWETTPARAEAALTPVEQRIVLTDRRTNARVVIELGPIKDGFRAARISGDTLPAWLDAAALEALRERSFGLVPN